MFNVAFLTLVVSRAVMWSDSSQNYEVTGQPHLSVSFLRSFDEVMLNAPFGTEKVCASFVGEKYILKFRRGSERVHSGSRDKISPAWKEWLDKYRTLCQVQSISTLLDSRGQTATAGDSESDLDFHFV